MGKRLSEKPLRIDIGVVESAANSRTIQNIVLPAVPSIAITRGDVKGIGIEIMKISLELSQVDPEAGQNNNVTYELVKGAEPAALLGAGNLRVILRRRSTLRGVTVTSVGELLASNLEPVIYDMTDGDGNGELVLDNEIHAQIQGSGNASAKVAAGYALYHLYEFDGTEALFEILEQAA